MSKKEHNPQKILNKNRIADPILDPLNEEILYLVFTITKQYHYMYDTAKSAPSFLALEFTTGLVRLNGVWAAQAEFTLLFN